MEFRLLGPVDIHVEGRPVALGRPQQRAVLAALAVDVGRPVPPDTLVDRVWDQDPPKRARGVLYSHLTRIRQLLESVEPGEREAALVRRSGGYVLDTDPDRVDLHRFRRLAAAAGDPHRPDLDRAGLLTEALGLWRGTPLADVRGQWAARSRAGWRQQHLDAAVAWAQTELRLGHGGQVITTVRELLAEYPLAEPLVGILMRALAGAGRDAEALESYATARTRLADELGTEPGPDLQATHQAILRGDRGPTAAVAAGPAYPRPAQLPRAVWGFTGRQHALAALDALLDPRDGQPATVVISALSGTAGIGKTALAVHWAHRVADRFPDGQLYVNLRGFDPTGQVMDPAEAVRRFLGALGAPAGRIPADLDAQAALYRSLLDGKRMLVVLDNAKDAEQVRPLLPGTAAALVVVTSRNQLTGLVAADGARPLTLDLLTTAEARELLTRRLGPDRVGAEPDAVEQIIAACARLPLALSIAAARAQQSGFALDVLAAELAQARRRLAALDAGDPATQVRAVFSWSYTALTPPAARMFRLLGVHPGPDVSVAAAASLAGVPVLEADRLLADLARASLVAQHAPGRYGCHDLLAEYAAELARGTETGDELRAARSRLLDHYTHTAHAAARLLDPTPDPMLLPLAPAAAGAGPEPLADERAALEWLTGERPVLLAALALAADTGFDTQVWQLAWALDTFLHWRGHWHDRVEAWQAAVAAADRLANPTAAAHAHRDLARAGNRLGRYDAGRAHLGRALDLFTEAGDQVGQAYTHRALASVCERQDQLSRALYHDEQALALFRAAGHDQGQADALNSVGWDHALLGDHARALAHCEQALTLHQRIGDRWGEATTWDSLGYTYHQLGRHTDAVDCYQHALALARDLGDRYHEADTAGRLGDTHHAAGDPAAARTAWTRALTILTDLDHPDAGDVRAKLAALAPRPD